MTYDFYLHSYGGSKVSADDFAARLRRAEFQLDHHTFKRYLKHQAEIEKDTVLSERVNMALCTIMDVQYDQDKRRGISSENNDGYSVSYASISKSEVRSMITPYIGDTWLMSRRI